MESKLTISIAVIALISTVATMTTNMTINVFAQGEPDQAQLQTNCQHGNQFACNAQPNGNPGCTIQVPGEPPLMQGCPQMADPNSR